MTPEEKDYEEAIRRIASHQSWLASLQSLRLAHCEQLSGNLSPLAGLTSLQTLNLSRCVGIRRFSVLESLLPTLHKLYLFNGKFEDLPSEVCGSHRPLSYWLDYLRAKLAG